MIISARRAHQDADRTAQRAITALFEQLNGQVQAAMLSQANEQGVVPLERLEDLRGAVQAVVEPAFVTREQTGGDELDDELARLNGLYERALAEFRQADYAKQQRIHGRISALIERIQFLTTAGVAFVAIRDGRPATPYAQLVLDGAESVSRAIIGRHAQAMTQMLARDPAVLKWLSGPVTFPLRDSFYRHQPIAAWLDARGYTLSDRIWNLNRITTRRIDALLADGIRQGRSAVSIAKDLERFLLPTRRAVTTKKPYGTIGSFDARRLARSEITRAASVSSYVAGISNPFVTRARYHLSGMHDPTNCDGSCDEHYATDQDDDGYPPDAVPLPMIDTHPLCMCYVTHETGNVDIVLMQLRADMGDFAPLGFEEPSAPPVTPLQTDLLLALVMGWAVDQFVLRA